MKRLIVVLFVFGLFSTQVHAQDLTSGLSDVQKAELALQAAKMKSELSDPSNIVQTLSEYGSLGKQVGEAVSVGLNSVVDVAERFSDTNVGQITIALIIWKVVGASIIKILLGIISLFVGIKVFSKLVLIKRVPAKWEDKPVLFGAFTRRIPVEWEELRRESEEMRVVGVLALIGGFLAFFISLANI